MNSSNSIFGRTFDPILQAAVALGGVVSLSLIAKFINWTGMIGVPQRFPWLLAAAFMLIYALFNSVFSVSSKNLMKYWGRSIYSFLGLAVCSSGFAYLASSLTMNEAGSYRWIFIVVSIGYLVFLSMMAMMRKIVEFAQREEWNHPRIRKR